jgi:glycosyltransferase involved in cell wall biosynthesis
MEYLGTDKPVNHIKPLVSVCVTTYQQVHYIAKCLNSILCQKTDFPFEIIVGEDDSNDGTRDICCKYAEKYPDKIRLFLRSRADVIHICGMPTGRHNFIENTKSSLGTYIALCEGDDYWTDPYKLQKQVDFIKRNPNTVMVAHIARIISSDEQTTHGLLPGKKQNTFLNPNSVIRRGGGFYATNSILFHKVIIESFPNWIYDFPVGDEALNLLALDKG